MDRTLLIRRILLFSALLFVGILLTIILSRPYAAASQANPWGDKSDGSTPYTLPSTGSFDTTLLGNVALLGHIGGGVDAVAVSVLVTS